MKTWRVVLFRSYSAIVPSEFIQIRGCLEVGPHGELLFSAAYDENLPDYEQSRLFRVIRDYIDCFAVNAEGLPLEPA